MPAWETRTTLTLARASGVPLRSVISPRGGNTHIQSHLVQKATGADIEVVEYEERSEVVDAIIAGELDWTTGVSSDFVHLVEQGTLQTVATFLPAGQPRHPLQQATPGLAESGIDVEFVLWRGLVGPAGIDADAIRAWGDRVDAARETRAWADYLVRAGLTDLRLDANGFGDLLARERTNYLGWLDALA